MEQSGLSEEELLRQQQELFRSATEKYNQGPEWMNQGQHFRDNEVTPYGVYLKNWSETTYAGHKEKGCGVLYDIIDWFDISLMFRGVMVE